MRARLVAAPSMISTVSIALLLAACCARARREGPCPDVPPSPTPAIAAPGTTAAVGWASVVADAVRLHARIEMGAEVETAAIPGPATIEGWTGFPGGRGVFVTFRRRGASDDAAQFLIAPWQAMTGAEPGARVLAVGWSVLAIGPAQGGDASPEAQATRTRASALLARGVSTRPDAGPVAPAPRAGPLPPGIAATDVTLSEHAVRVRIPAEADPAAVEDALPALAQGRVLVVERARRAGPSSYAVFPPAAEPAAGADRLRDEGPLTAIFAGALKEAMAAVERDGDPGETARRDVYARARPAIDQPAAAEMLGNLLALRFPDYRPKASPDLATDYRPSIGSLLAALPPEDPASLPALLAALESAKADAERNPGRREPGHVGLGADPEEYVPSDAEIVASEIGERIRRVLERAGAAAPAGGGAEGAVEYLLITYRHVDVMGSGRFTYASAPMPVRIPLRR